MIRIECDNCEMPFEVDPAASGSKVACPECGDVNRVPVAAAEPLRAARAEPARDAAEETEICVVRPGMFRAHPFRYALIVLLFVGGVALAIASTTSERVAPWLLWPALVVAAAMLAWFGLWWLTTHWWVKLVITNKRTVRHEGIVRRHTTEVLHDHVRSVDIDQRFLQRVFGVGAIGIDSAGQEDIEIEVQDIPRPYEVKRIIDRYRKM